MATLNEALTLEFKGDATHYFKALGKMKRDTKSVVSGISANFLSIGKTIAKVGAVGVAAIGGFAAVAVAKAAKAEKSFANLAGLFKESTEELKGYRDEIDRLSWSMGRSTVEVTDAFYQAISAGYRSIEDSAAIVEASTKAAIAGGSDISTSVDAITRTLTAYNLTGKDATRVSDLLFQTVNYGVTRFEELAPSIGAVAPMAHEAGISIEEMFAAVAQLTKFASTTEAVTQLTSLIRAFLKPTKEAQEIAADYGFELSAATLSSKGLTGALKEMLEAVPKDKWAEMLGRVEGYRAALGLAQEDGKQFAAILKEMGGDFGAMANAFEKQKNTFAEMWRTFKESVSKAWETIGIPVMEAMKRLLTMWETEILPKLMTWSAGVREAVAAYWKVFDEEMAGASAQEKLKRMWKDFTDWFKKEALPGITEAALYIGKKFGEAFMWGIKTALGMDREGGLGFEGGWWDVFMDFLEGFTTFKAKGHIPNYAGGNVGDLSGLINAYMQEKKMGPPGSKPVIANDSEYIIPSRAGGQVPNFQGGNSGLFEEAQLTNSLLQKLLMVWDSVPNELQEMGDKVANAIKDMQKSMETPKMLSRTELLWGYKKPFQHGGMVYGENAEVPIRAHRGEYVVNPDSTAAFLPLLEAINAQRGGQFYDASTVNMNFGDRWSDRLMRDKVIPAFISAKRRGLMDRRW